MAPVQSMLGRSAAPLTLALAIALFASACDNGNGPSGTVTEVSFCPDEAPVWFAVQDGDGPWTRLAPVSEGVYEVTLTTGRGGVAYVGREGYGLVVNYGVADELGTVRCRQGFGTIYGNVQNATRAAVWLGSAEASIDDDLRLTIYRAPSEPQDLLAASDNMMPEAVGFDRIILRRKQQVPSGGQLALLDFGSAEAFAPAVVNVGATGVGSMGSNLRTIFTGNQGSMSVWLSYRANVSEVPVPMHVIPASQLQPGELSAVQLMAFDGVTDREVATFVSTPADMMLALGPPLNIPDVSLDATATALYPYVLLASQPEYGRLASARFIQPAAEVVVTVTSGYLGGVPQQWNILVPNLSAVEGWGGGWNLDPMQGVDWAVSAAGGVNLTLGDVVQGGNQYQRATVYSWATSGARASRIAPGDASRSWGFPPIPKRPSY